MIIGVSGKIKSGKNEFYGHLSKLMLKDGIICDEFSFAHNLKLISALLFGLSYRKECDREFKEDIFIDLSTFNTYLRTEVEDIRDKFDYIYDSTEITEFIQMWDTKLKGLTNSQGPNKPTILITMRIWLQYFGTNVCRSFVDNTWVNSTIQSLHKGLDYICTDVRFPNEADAIRSNGGIVIRIEREVCNQHSNSHISEIAMDGYGKYNYEIHNNGTLEEFHTKIEELYESIKHRFI